VATSNATQIYTSLTDAIRRVEDLVQAMGLTGISKSQVSKLCKDIDERANAFLERPIEGEGPYLWLDATYLKVREGGRIVSVAAIIAVAVSTDGRRPSAHGLDPWGEIIGLGIGPSEAEPFWSISSRAWSSTAWRASSRSSPRLMTVCAPRLPGCSARPGKDAARTGCARRSRTYQKASTR
jgi:hypothetical protein